MAKLDKQFEATLRRSGSKGGWTYVVMPGSAEYFGTRGLVKAETRRAIAKEAGGQVTVRLEERIES